MKYVLTHYQGDTEWAKEYTNDLLVYNRSGQDIPGSISRENIGDADYDRLSYIVDNYHELPDVFLLSKSNLFKYCPREEFDLVKDNRDFTPLLTKHHKTYSDERGVVCKYEGGIYAERNDSWYVNSFSPKYFNSYEDFAKAFHLPNPDFLKFAPGGNYIVTRERVHRYGIDLYKDLASILPYCQRPAEAHMIERTYYNLWS